MGASDWDSVGIVMIQLPPSVVLPVVMTTLTYLRYNMILQYRLPGYSIVTAFIKARQGRSVRWNIQAHLRRAFQKKRRGAGGERDGEE